MLSMAAPVRLGQAKEHQVTGEIRLRSGESASGEIKLREIGGDEAGLRNVQVAGGAGVISRTAYRRDIKQPVLFD
jgi:hypothetical protein